ncbi:MAG TPA: energy transducer TonB [Allosphingosinicella sp.]|jgi:protein TonB|nr:energy transducer TonB [Allosphingosinicella sp.]
MSALALAMVLTGAGGLSRDDAQRHGPPPPPYYATPPVPPPPPAGGARPPLRARANLNSYFSADDYPAMEDGRQEGTVVFRLTIGTNGRVTDCRVTGSSGSATLDQTTCRVLRARARYTPARDSAGNPTTGSDSGRVTWRLPDETEGPADRRAGIPIPFASAERRAPLQSYIPARDNPAGPGDRATGITSVRLVVGMTGRVIACDALEDRGATTAPIGGPAACRAARARARYKAARSEAGGFVCDVAFEDVRWRLPPPRAVAPPPIAQQLAPGACPGQASRVPPPPPTAVMPVPPPVPYPIPVSPPPFPPPPPMGIPPQRVRPNLGEYFSVDDYPPAALRAQQEGMVGFRLTVGRDGRVSRCRATSTSGSVALDRATCAILRRRARYWPARDAGGRPTRGTDAGRISWRLPAD